MGTVFCDNCGTSLLDENAKYCRACGKPTPLSEAATPESEEATKRFAEQPATESSTRPVGASPTAPAYMSPMPLYPVPPGVATNDLRQKSQKRNLIIIGSMMAVMIFALAGLLFFLNFGIDGPEGIPPPTPPSGLRGGPGGVPPPGVPAPPGVPMPPGVPPSGASTIDSTLIYPGARQTMLVTGEGSKTVLGLASNDATRKVADWYEARLTNAKKVTFAGQTVLEAGDLSVVIMGSNEGSQILITRGGKGK